MKDASKKEQEEDKEDLQRDVQNELMDLMDLDEDEKIGKVE
jgi:hypothetical protein